MLGDVLSPPRFLVDVFSFVVHAEFEVGVLALEEFRWKIFPDEDLEPLVVLVCDTIRRITQFAQLLSQAHMLKINRDHRARLVSSNRESFAYTNSIKYDTSSLRGGH